MLTTNVLCLKKKRKKKSYYVANVSQYGGKATATTADNKRSPGSAVAMMHITEDTPPDMLAGAMDLTVHLPTGRSVKLSVERSTPMMDLLVQITTAHNLQLSGHILEAMDMTRTGGIGDRVLPYKPNTPIGALDTQHIKVVPKNKTASTFPKSLSTGHQPFESTFRLKVHLPRNQLYVTRVSQNVYLEEIVKKVCEEKGLDPTKYELRHPGNLDEVLDPKLTLSDYQITEIYVVGKGSGRLTQTFSSSDIMALRKEEERKQFQAKTGGGVFNLIFKRSKTTAPEPTHSHSVTQPVELPKPSTVPVIKDPPQPDPRPKPPQRKRRPAPKPPVEAKNPTIERNPRPVSCSSNTGLIISHSRNSSDSSGYHEASVLSENCNTSLPRRPKSIYDENGNRAKVNGVHSRSTGNLEKMQGQSKSMSSLAAPARKKKAAPPPPKPPVQKPDADTVEPASPVVASQPIETTTAPALDRSASPSTNAPVPAPRKSKTSSATSSLIEENERTISTVSINEKEQKIEGDEISIKIINKKLLEVNSSISNNELEFGENSPLTPEVNFANKFVDYKLIEKTDDQLNFGENSPIVPEVNFTNKFVKSSINTVNKQIEKPPEPIEETKTTEIHEISPQSELDSVSMDMQLDDNDNQSIDTEAKFAIKDDDSYYSGESLMKSLSMDSLRSDFSATSANSKGSKPEIVGVIPKKRKSTHFDTFTRTRGFQIGTSLINMESESDRLSLSTHSETTSIHSSDNVTSPSRFNDFEGTNDFRLDVKEEIFKEKPNKGGGSRNELKRNDLLELHTIDQDVKSMNKIRSVTSLRSVDSLPGFIKKWTNDVELDNISNVSEGSLRFRSRNWILGDNSDTESISTNITTNITPPESPIISSPQTQNKSTPLVDPTEEIKETPIILETKPNESELKSETNDFDNKNEVDSGICENNLSDTAEKEEIIEKNIDKNSDNVLKVEPEWQYQLPSPPKGFRDVSPSLQTYECETETVSDSVVTSPELFEKLKRVHDIQSVTSDLPSVVSQEEIFEEKDICNKLTLENLEKRKSLVYNRELATSLKYAESEANSDKRSNVMLELEDVIANEKSSTFLRSNNSKPSADSKNDRHLPNFKISTYDTKKEKINIFEDETVRSSENSCKVTSEKERGSDDVPEQPIVLRAESFSGPRLPLNPVRRSKSQVALNKYKDTKQNSCNESVSRSNSLLDVSGLQSLEVMKIIQNKLSSSKDTINKIPQPEPKQEKIEPPPIEKKPVKEPNSPIKEPTLTTTTNSYTAPKRQFYQGPPCIELGSWSQRPKTEITLKEDTDYKLGTGTLRTNSSTVYLSNSSNFKKQNGASVKIGKPNHVVTTQAQGSVVISINNEQKETDRETNQFKNEMFRKPIEKQRPHSIAIDNRIPIVRSVELKKEFQDLPSKSITEITSNVINFDNQPKSMSYVNLFANNENPDKTYRKDSFSRTVVRNNSFTPVVRGFRVPNVSNETINKKPWESYGTLPNNKSSSPGQDSSANKQTRTSEVFSQTTLRRTDSSHSVNNSANTNGKHVFGNVVLRNNSNKYSKPEYRHSASVIPPPPPVMLKPVKKVSNPTPASMDSRDRLLDEIRNFGGKKGLKTTK